jgi:hypothetical protein
MKRNGFEDECVNEVEFENKNETMNVNKCRNVKVNVQMMEDVEQVAIKYVIKTRELPYHSNNILYNDMIRYHGGEVIYIKISTSLSSIQLCSVRFSVLQAILCSFLPFYLAKQY